MNKRMKKKLMNVNKAIPNQIAGCSRTPWSACEYQRTDTDEICFYVSTNLQPGLGMESNLGMNNRSLFTTTGGAYCKVGKDFYDPKVVAENRANCALVIRAVNAYQEFMDAIITAEQEADYNENGTVTIPLHVLDRLRAAKHKAEV